jgi:t-SNARE complex subunit (syntaxin)
MDEDKEKMINQITDFRIFMSETVIYRTESVKRMDDLIKEVHTMGEKIQNLPCKERAYIPLQLKAIWCFIGGIVLVIIKEAFNHK